MATGGDVLKLLWITARRFGVDQCQTTQLSLAKHLVGLGWEIQFICPNNCSPPEGLESILFHGIGIGGPPGLRGPLYELAIRKQIKKLLSVHSPSAVLVDWRCTVGSQSILKKAGIPWLMIDRGPPAHSGILAFLQKLHYRKAWNNASKSASCGFVVSEKHRDYIKKKRGKKPSIHVVPAAVDAERFIHHKDRNGTFNIVYHGKVDHNRNVDTLIPLIEKVRAMDVDCELMIIGGGNAVKGFRRSSTSRTWLKVLGQHPQDKIPTLLAQADIGLLPMGATKNWSLASPIKMFEYAAAGMMILGTDIEAHRIFSAQDWVHLVDPENFVEEGAEVLKKISTQKDEFKSLGEAARELVSTNHTWKQSAKIIDEHLRISIRNT